MTKIFKPVCLMVVMALVLSLGALVVPRVQVNAAGPLNGGFETGDLTSWTVGGVAAHVEVLQSTNFAAPIGVPEGSYFVLLSSGPMWVNFPPILEGDWDGNGFQDCDTSTLSQTFTLTAGEVPATLSFQWSFLTAEVASDPPPYGGWDYDDIFRVRLNGTNICTGSVPGVGTFVSPFPDVPVDGLTYHVTSPGSTNNSHFDDGRSAFQTFTYTITTADTYTLEFLLADQAQGGEIDSGLLIDAVLVEVAEGVVADFSGTPTEGIAALDVDFTDLSTGEIDSWSWDFGDTGTSSAQNPSHTYTEGGTYTVSLTVTSGESEDTETKTDYITVYEGAVADFSATPTSGTAALDVDFTDESLGDIDTWSWDFGDGDTSSAQNPSHEYTKPGTYDVSLTVSGDGGEDTETKTDYIEVSPATIYSNCATTEPDIDGAFGSNEWSDATEVDFLAADPDNELEAYAYFMNDDDYLYIAVDVPDDTTEDAGDASGLAFDTGHDEEYTIGHDDIFFIEEGDSGPTWHYVFVGDGDDGDGYEVHCEPFDTSLPLHSGLAGDWGLGSSPNSATDHRIYEFRIPLALLLASPGDTLGFAMDGMVYWGIYDVDSGSGDQWPFYRGEPIYIDEYGDLVLATCAPEADFIGEPREGLVPLEVQFTDKSSGSITSWQWAFGDGETSQKQNPSHTYNTPGVYTVSLTVRGSTDRETKTDYITVLAPRRPEEKPLLIAPAMLSVHNLVLTSAGGAPMVTPAQVYPNDAVTISAEVVNKGDMRGTKQVELMINGQVEQRATVVIPGHSSQPVSFTVYRAEPGVYTVYMEGITDYFTVLYPEGGGLVGGGLDSGGIIAIVIIGFMLIAGIIVAMFVIKPS